MEKLKKAKRIIIFFIVLIIDIALLVIVISAFISTNNYEEKVEIPVKLAVEPYISKGCTVNVMPNKVKSAPEGSNTNYSVITTSIDNPPKLIREEGEDRIYPTCVFVKSSEELSNVLKNNFEPRIREVQVEDKSIEEYYNDEFFENNNLAIYIYYEYYIVHTPIICGIIQNEGEATINMKDFAESNSSRKVYYPLVFKLITLDKSVDSVIFNAYVEYGY